MYRLSAALCLCALLAPWALAEPYPDPEMDLENILQNLDEIDRKTFIDDEEENDQWIGDLAHGSTAQHGDPCAKHLCAWGQECRATRDGRPQCECIERCPDIPNPDPFDQVCSNQEETYSSLCELYRQRCVCRRGKPGCTDQKHAKAHLEYLGRCKELEVCTEEHMEQFPERMADWLFQVMRDVKKRQELHGNSWLTLYRQAETDDHLKHVYPVIWKFCDLDRRPPHKTVSKHELIPITAPIIPMESCIKPFLERCDNDHDGSIDLHEWGRCLGLKPNEIVERC